MGPRAKFTAVGQAWRTRVVPAKTVASNKRLKFSKSFSFKQNVKKVLGNLSFVGRLCIEDFTIVVHLVNRLVTWFNNPFL